jgi:hypothetical protein
VLECIHPGTGELCGECNGLGARTTLDAGALLGIADDDPTATTTTGSIGFPRDIRLKTDIIWVGMADDGLPV